jgi:hypothetical protein
LGGVSQTFLPHLAWNCGPPHLNLSCRLECQVQTTLPNYWLRWRSREPFAWAGLKLQSFPSQPPK